jgi:hypothetical protein
MVDLVAAEPDWVHERIPGRFAGRAAGPGTEVVDWAGRGLERQNGWALAERAGEVSPDGMQRLLRRANQDVDGFATTGRC